MAIGVARKYQSCALGDDALFASADDLSAEGAGSDGFFAAGIDSYAFDCKVLGRKESVGDVIVGTISHPRCPSRRGVFAWVYRLGRRGQRAHSRSRRSLLCRTADIASCACEHV